MKYDIHYFIAKFEAIPDNKWCVEKFTDEKGRCCALGHCGVRGSNTMFCISTKQGEALKKILPDGVTSINDGVFKGEFKGKTPKARILEALRRKLKEE